MKNLFKLFLLCALSHQATAQTNIYHPLPDSAQWNYYGITFCAGPTSGHEWYTLIMNSDTLINATTYKRITSPGTLIHRPSFCNTPPVNDSTYFQPSAFKIFIREDTVQKKIYVWNSFANADNLLYDFNLQVGDTVPGILANVLPPVEMVVNIDSILIGANYHKRFLVNPMYSIHWIEGVGSTYGFFRGSPGNMWDMNQNLLLCFKANGNIVYNFASSSCDIVTSLEEKTIINPVELYPNPASESITASWPDTFQPSSCTIKNITGQHLSTFSISPGINNTRIQLNAFEPGLYILEFEENNTIYPMKFIRE